MPPSPNDYSPQSLGPRLAAGFYLRHVKGPTFKNVAFAYEYEDPRPALVASEVDGFTLDDFKFQRTGAETLRLERIKNLTVLHSRGITDLSEQTVEAPLRITAAP